MQKETKIALLQVQVIEDKSIRERLESEVKTVKRLMSDKERKLDLASEFIQRISGKSQRLLKTLKPRVETTQISESQNHIGTRETQDDSLIPSHQNAPSLPPLETCIEGSRESQSR